MKRSSIPIFSQSFPEDEDINLLIDEASEQDWPDEHNQDHTISDVGNRTISLLHNLPDIDTFEQTKEKNQRTHSIKNVFSPGEARKIATKFIYGGLNDSSYTILDTVNNAGIILGSQLKTLTSLSERTIALALKDRLIDPVSRPIYEKKISPLFSGNETDKKTLDNKAYVLGPIGVEIIRILQPKSLVQPEICLQQAAHDIATVEVICYLKQLAQRYQISTEWYNRFSGAVINPENPQNNLLEPDSMLHLVDSAKDRSGVFLIEYHNEYPSAHRATLKIEKYLDIYSQTNENNRPVWEYVYGSRFPVLLVVYRSKGILEEYLDIVSKISIGRGIPFNIFAKPWSMLRNRDHFGHWIRINTKEWGRILNMVMLPGSPFGDFIDQSIPEGIKGMDNQTQKSGAVK